MGALTTTLPASHGPSELELRAARAAGAAGAGLDRRQPLGARVGGGVNGLCVGRPGLKSSCKENSWGRGQPGPGSHQIRPLLPLNTHRSGCSSPTPTPQHSPGSQGATALPATAGAVLEPTLEEAGPLPLPLPSSPTLQLRGVCKPEQRLGLAGGARPDLRWAPGLQQTDQRHAQGMSMSQLLSCVRTWSVCARVHMCVAVCAHDCPSVFGSVHMWCACVSEARCTGGHQWTRRPLPSRGLYSGRGRPSTTKTRAACQSQGGFTALHTTQLSPISLMGKLRQGLW